MSRDWSEWMSQNAPIFLASAAVLATAVYMKLKPKSTKPYHIQLMEGEFQSALTQAIAQDPEWATRNSLKDHIAAFSRKEGDKILMSRHTIADALQAHGEPHSKIVGAGIFAGSTSNMNGGYPSFGEVEVTDASVKNGEHFGTSRFWDSDGNFSEGRFREAMPAITRENGLVSHSDWRRMVARYTAVDLAEPGTHRIVSFFRPRALQVLGGRAEADELFKLFATSRDERGELYVPAEFIEWFFRSTPIFLKTMEQLDFMTLRADAMRGEAIQERADTFATCPMRR